MIDISKTVAKQKAFYLTGASRDVSFRLAQLKKLRVALQANQSDIEQAMYADFRKSAFEVYTSEFALIISDIKKFERNLRRWARPKTVRRTKATMHAKGTIVHEPYGVALIISPWNYPVQLTLAPLIGAMAAGNTAVVKPSRHVPNTAAVMKRIIEENFGEEYIAMVEGGSDVNAALLAQRYDYIFFTGGTKVGRIIMQTAAQTLTPVTLELGGKTPCIVDETAHIKEAAKAICWGRFFNAGQTCISPDYVMVHRSAKDALLEEMAKTVRRFYGDDPQQSPDLARLINDKHFERVAALIDKEKVYIGGQTAAADRYIAPTILTNVTFDDAVMSEEIFGPLLPVIEYDDTEEMIGKLAGFESPLALYVFCRNKKTAAKYLRRLPSGGAVVNDTMIQFINSHLPFGGKGNSGIGNYHGKHSFETFSHKRAVVFRSLLLDLPRYAPYKNKLGLIRKLL